MLSVSQGTGSVRDFEDPGMRMAYRPQFLTPPVPGSSFFAQPFLVAVKSRSPLKPFGLLFAKNGVAVWCAA